MAELTSWCRACPSLCGVLVTSADGRIHTVRGDAEHPLSQGFDCAYGRDAPRQVNRGDRCTDVLRADGQGGLTPSSLPLAIDDLGSAIQSVVRRDGWRAVGVLLGGDAQHSQRTLRTLAALRDRLGPVSVFTPRARETVPFRNASRLVLGQARTLRADVARTHHLLLLGGNQLEQGWVHGHAGRALLSRLEGRRRARPHVSVADPRSSGLAMRARHHLSILPGTELYLLLGMASAMLRSGWYDVAHVGRRTVGLEALSRALEPWTPARTAELCGLGVADINAEALRFSRAPTAAILASPQALGTPWSTLTAWAALVLQALTSNLLEPGGLFAHPGALTPRPSLPEQNETSLAAALGRRVRILICVDADPVSSLPGVEGRLGELERLVCIDRLLLPTCRQAHWVLPGTHYLEEPELGYGDAADRHWFQWSSGLAVPPQACRTPSDWLDSLLQAGSTGGTASTPSVDHLRVERASLAGVARTFGGDTSKLDAAVQVQLTRTADMPRGYDGGAVDRADWAVHHPDGRLHLAPTPMLEALARHVPEGHDPQWPLRLISSARRDPARGPAERAAHADDGGVGLHPDQGFEQGQLVRIRSLHGDTVARVVLDPGLQPAAVDLPVGFSAQPMVLVDPTHLDRWSDSAWTDGQPCRVEPVVDSSSEAAPKPRA